MKQEIKEKCYLLSLEGYTTRQIGDKLNVSHATVSRALNSITTGNDYQLALKGCSVLLQEFVKYQDYCKKKINELDQLKEEKKEAMRNNMTTGEIEVKEIELSPIEKLSIIRTQNDIYKDLLTLGSQGEFIQAVRKIRDKIGELPEAKE